MGDFEILIEFYYIYVKFYLKYKITLNNTVINILEKYFKLVQENPFVYDFIQQK